MTETWRPGDLAECIKTTAWSNRWGSVRPGPAYGEIYVVLSVTRATLAFKRFAPYRYNAGYFRKIVPHADAPIAADRAFINRMRRKELGHDYLFDRLFRPVWPVEGTSNET